MTAVITLLTDFGLADSYVAEVKGVLLTRAPGVTLVDVSHEVPPGDVRAASFILSRVWHRFPRGTVHLAVVDPGVGTARRALAARAGGHFFVAPDNGLLSPLPADAEFVALPVPADASATFHGRDVFAPAAARLAVGAALGDLGPVVRDPVRVPMPSPRRDGSAWAGEVIYVDRFGTLVSNLPGERLGPGGRVVVGDTDVGPLRRTFADVERGELVAFVGSGATVEIAVREGSAARRLGVGVGTPVRWVRPGSPPTASGS
ncbi:MAG TPA: SAM-dependent chlorinase/fluorinase [Gemmatimonadales bacterium]|nr:SAM-dependent chlorinase/fluorinase [Gemmatimonadales bacterium]